MVVKHPRQRGKYKEPCIREQQAVQICQSTEFEAGDEIGGEGRNQIIVGFVHLIQRAVKDLKPGS